jgi:hypothetical protein
MVGGGEGGEALLPTIRSGLSGNCLNIQVIYPPSVKC